MSVRAAYLGVILVWSTTPLGIKWSSEGLGFLFGVSGRMFLGLLLCLALARALRVPLPLDARARRTYLAAGVAIYGAMLATYWSAQFIPSGLISVVFGLSPIVTGIFAAAWLNERALTVPRLAGALLGLAGLALVFHTELALGPHAAQGIFGVLLGVTLNAASAVGVKRIGAHLPPLAVTSGGLAVACVLYALTLLILHPAWPAVIPMRALAAMVYLALFGSVIGFVMYYYVLRHLPTGEVALITLITPVTALLLGHALNGEPLSPGLLAGTALILGGLAVHQWGGRVRLRARRVAMVD